MVNNKLGYAAIALLVALRGCAALSPHLPKATPPDRAELALTQHGDRRAFLSTMKNTVPGAFVVGAMLDGPGSAFAAAGGKESLLADLRSSKEKMAPIPELLQNQQWDSVRTILKTPPVNQLWNLGESQNTLVKLAKETDEFGLLELKDELAISLQMCDQYTYDNAFVYFQPGNGKYKLKEPTELANRAMGQIQDAIDMVQ